MKRYSMCMDWKKIKIVKCLYDVNYRFNLVDLKILVIFF